ERVFQLLPFLHRDRPFVGGHLNLRAGPADRQRLALQRRDGRFLALAGILARLLLDGVGAPDRRRNPLCVDRQHFFVVLLVLAHTQFAVLRRAANGRGDLHRQAEDTAVVGGIPLRGRLLQPVLLLRDRWRGGGEQE